MPNYVRTIVTHLNDDGTSSFVERIVPQLTIDDETGKKVFAGNLLWGTEPCVVVGALVGAERKDER
jgi:hypothetical protein